MFEETLYFGIAAINELSNLHASTQKPLTQYDFDQVISACRKHSAKKLRNLISDRVKVSPRKDDVVPRNL